MTQPSRSMRDRKLLAYAVGGIALTASESQGEVVYHNLGVHTIGPGDSFSLDIDQNGFDDLSLSLNPFHWSSCTTSTTSTTWCPWCTSTSTSYARGGGRGGWTCTSSRGINAWANGLGAGRGATKLISDGNISWHGRLFAADELINPALAEAQSGLLAQYVVESNGWTYHGGPFFGQRGYLGFAISGGAKAGWAQIEVELSKDNPNDIAAIHIFDYAYQTLTNTPIAAGDTGAEVNLPGDTNADGQVDLVDLNNVRNNFGATEVGVLGDTNDDGLVDLEDLNAVRNNFGAGNPVPEPPSLVLLAAGAAGVTTLRRRRAQLGAIACST